MSMRARMETNLTWLAHTRAFMVDLPVAVELSGDDAFEQARGAFLQDLRYQPGPTGTPERHIEWTSYWQQQAYFASNGFGGGIPTIRTGKLAKDWTLKSVAKRKWFGLGGRWEVSVENPNTAARFVYGSLALHNPKAAERFQQRFHQITGWPTMVYQVLDWFELLQEQFTGNMNILIDEIGTPKFKQRGFTPRLPKRRQ